MNLQNMNNGIMERKTLFFLKIQYSKHYISPKIITKFTFYKHLMSENSLRFFLKFIPSFRILNHLHNFLFQFFPKPLIIWPDNKVVDGLGNAILLELDWKFLKLGS